MRVKVKRKKEEKAKVDNDSAIDITMDTTVSDLDSRENFAKTHETPKLKKQKINIKELTPKQEEVVKTRKVKENGDVQNEKAVKTPKETKDKTPKPDTPAKELKTPNNHTKD